MGVDVVYREPRRIGEFVGEMIHRRVHMNDAAAVAVPVMMVSALVHGVSGAGL